MESSIMATAFKSQINDGLEQAKTVSTSRWRSIRGILAETLTRLGSEFVSGVKELGVIGREVASAAQVTWEEDGQIYADRFKAKVAEKATQYWEALKQAGRDRLPWIQAKLATVDQQLADRYSETYGMLKRRIKGMVALYQAISTAPPAEANPTKNAATIEVPYQIITDQTSAFEIKQTQPEA
jgi:predicted trehalose synthase